MKSIKILIPYPTGHETVSIRTMLFNNMIPILKKTTNVKIQRIIYQPEKLDGKVFENSDVETLDLHNYENAFDVLQQEKPDLIYANPYPGFIDFAFAFSGKILNIPVFSILNYDSSQLNSFDSFIMNSRKLFSNFVEVEISKNKKSFMRRAKFIFYKFSFLMKTVNSSKLRFLKKLKTILMIIKLTLRPSKIVDPRLAVTKHYLRNETQEKELLSLGFDPTTLLVTGHPMFDQTFKKIKNDKNIFNTDKIRILFAPDPYYESGEWTKKQHESILSGIVKTIMKNDNQFSLTIKIHPSSTVLSEYEPIIHSIDKSIPIFQKGSIEDFLDEADVVVSYSSQSTGLVFSLIQKKPIVICNFFKVGFDNRLTDDGLAKECKDLSSLIKTIKFSVKPDELYEKRRQDYIKKYFFKDDGLASERICNDLLNFLKT